MRRNRAKRRAAGPEVTAVVMMRLYIANNAPNSVQALANLAEICKEHMKENYMLEVIDVIDDPLRALADGILVTPSLAKLSPAPATKIVGNLSDRSSVLRALGIKESIQ